MHYVDTSAIVALLTEEVATETVRKWFDDHMEAGLALSNWTAAEISSALSLKVRTGQLPIDQRNEVLTLWRAELSSSFARLQVTAADFEDAAAMAEQHELSLRAGDALHIAIARNAGCTLVTLDKRMAEAALKLGVPVAAI
jgi:uncharacterized protein